jgi:hypothetical protein
MLSVPYVPIDIELEEAVPAAESVSDPTAVVPRIRLFATFRFDPAPSTVTLPVVLVLSEPLKLALPINAPCNATEPPLDTVNFPLVEVAAVPLLPT